MDLIITLALLAAVVGLGALCAWLGGRPPNPFKGPRLIPYRLLMLLCAGGALVLLTHLAGALGIARQR
jgi:hypothetical protein